MFVWTLYDGTWVGWGKVVLGGTQLGMNGCGMLRELLAILNYDFVLPDMSNQVFFFHVPECV